MCDDHTAEIRNITVLMAKSLKSPGWQLVILLSFYPVFGILAIVIDVITCYLLTGSNLTELEDVDLSMPNVLATWKLISISDAIFGFLLPALLFARMVSPKPVAWLQLNKPIRLK